MITARAASFTRRPYGTNRCGSRETRPERAEPPGLSLADRECCGPELTADLAGRVFLGMDVDVGAARFQCVQHRGIDGGLALRTTLARGAQRHDHRPAFPRTPRWMCAATAFPVRRLKVSREASTA